MLCIGKLMEQKIKRRFNLDLEYRNVFKATESDFRNCRSTLDILATLKLSITYVNV